MTPMVDLAFLLLTFFVMTTTFNKPYVMKMTMPEKDDRLPAPPLPASRALTLILGDNNKIYWYQGLVDPKIEVTTFSTDGIRKLLAKKNKQMKKMMVLIKPSSKSKYKNIVDILDEMLITNIDRYALVDITPLDEELIRLKH